VQEEDEVTPIWAMARTASPVVTPDAQSSDVCAAQNEVAVRIAASRRPIT
jgi:hypothetical protein